MSDGLAGKAGAMKIRKPSVPRGRSMDFLKSPLKKEDFYTGLICLFPSVLVILVFTLYPIGYSLFLSFHKWSILSPVKTFLGLGNYARLFQSQDFWMVLKNSAIYTAGVVSVGAAASLGLAVLLNRGIAGAGFFRTTFFLPAITSTIALSIVWLWLYNTDNGLFNIVLRAMRLKPVPWLTSSKTALMSVMIMTVWTNAGYHMIILLGGLQSIPETYYEAAKIDGASASQRFRYITWPMILPALAFVLVTNTIFTFQAFGQIFTMTGGGPAQSTSLIMYFIYQRAFESQEMGYASAISWVVFLILIVLTLVQLRIQKREL
jgi:multiple sugar transport system permease protein